jgi:outer membrane biosynthesis protein TonB
MMRELLLFAILGAMLTLGPGVQAQGSGESSSESGKPVRIKQKPVLLQGKLPAVPPELAPTRRLSLIVEFKVNKNGTVSNVRARGTRDRQLLDLFTKAISGWRYRPMTIDGEPTEVEMDMKLTLPGVPRPLPEDPPS